jgi:hypothetical protein
LIVAAVLAFLLIAVFSIKMIRSKTSKIDIFSKQKAELNESNSGVDLKVLFNNKSHFQNLESQSKLDGLDDNSIKE